MEQMTEREKVYLQASIFQCKTQLSLGQTPDPTMNRFVVDMAQRLLEQLDRSETRSQVRTQTEKDAKTLIHF